jgi:hypothetical protein
VNITATVGVHHPIRSQYAYSNIAKLRWSWTRATKVFERATKQLVIPESF